MAVLLDGRQKINERNDSRIDWVRVSEKEEWGER